jgi:hypothetical protein
MLTTCARRRPHVVWSAQQSLVDICAPRPVTARYAIKLSAGPGFKQGPKRWRIRDRCAPPSKLPLPRTWRYNHRFICFFGEFISHHSDSFHSTRQARLHHSLPLHLQLTPPPQFTPPHITMLASSRTALRHAAAKQLSLKSSVRAVSVWSQIAQGPPVSA